MNVDRALQYRAFVVLYHCDKFVLHSIAFRVPIIATLLHRSNHAGQGKVKE
jgi:hypothetical protein